MDLMYCISSRHNAASLHNIIQRFSFLVYIKDRLWNGSFRGLEEKRTDRDEEELIFNSRMLIHKNELL